MKTNWLCFIGDNHGHLQLGLCIAAQWQRCLGIRFEPVFLCDDSGSFTSDAQLDSTTRRHAKANPCELEFLHQWSAAGQAPWLARIFASGEHQGLGLDCPVVMVHGNHEGFAHLESLIPKTYPKQPCLISELPSVDTGGFIRYLPSGYRCVTESNKVIGGVGGIERGQRTADYHNLAYLDEIAILQQIELGPLDVLVTHQGPSRTQGEHGSPLLDLLLDANLSPYWFHGHSIPHPDIVTIGPGNGTTVVPLGPRGNQYLRANAT